MSAHTVQDVLQRGTDMVAIGREPFCIMIFQPFVKMMISIVVHYQFRLIRC